MDYPLYPAVTVQPSTSSYGRWVVRYSEIHFRFFWKKAQASAWANAYNNGQADI